MQDQATNASFNLENQELDPEVRAQYHFYFISKIFSQNLTQNF